MAAIQSKSSDDGKSSELFWRAPRRLRLLLEDGEVTPTEFALIVYVGMAGERDNSGIATTREFLAGIMDVSLRTIQRALKHLAALHLVENDLRQGQRTPFRIWLGEVGRVETVTSDTTSDSTSDTTSDTARGSRVRSHFGQPLALVASQPVSPSGIEPSATSDSRARTRKTETEIEIRQQQRPIPTVVGKTTEPSSNPAVAVEDDTPAEKQELKKQEHETDQEWWARILAVEEAKKRARAS